MKEIRFENNHRPYKIISSTDDVKDLLKEKEGELFYDPQPIKRQEYCTVFSIVAIVICDIDYNGTITINKKCFSHWYFLGSVNLFRFTFDDRTDFSYATFYEDVNFSMMKFEKEVSFAGVTFCNKANFSFSEFICEAIFMSTKFHEVSFLLSNFSGPVDFLHANFFNNSNFEQVTFLDKLQFRYATFFKKVCFRETNFVNTHADFFDARFFGYSDFKGVNFKNSSADFSHAKFNDNVTFKDVEFNGSLFLRNAIFNQRVEFRGAQFDSYVDLIGTDFIGSVFMDPKKIEEKTEPSKLICEGGMVHIEDFPSLTITIKEEKRLESKRIHFADLLMNKIIKKTKHNSQYIIFIQAIENKMCLIENVKKIINENDDININDDLLENYCDEIYRIWERTVEHNKLNIHAAKRLCNKMGFYDSEDYFWYWYKVYDRKSKPYWFRLIDGLFLEKMTGYFTKPIRVFFSMISFVIIWGVLYCLPCCSIKGDVSWDALKWSLNSVDNVIVAWNQFITNISQNLGDSLYFSAASFSTIGYGDLKPVGFVTKFLATLEGIFGVILMSTFLVTLTRKYLR